MSAGTAPAVRRRTRMADTCVMTATPGAPPGVEGAVCLYTRDLDGVVVEIMIIDDPPPEENKAPPSEG